MDTGKRTSLLISFRVFGLRCLDYFLQTFFRISFNLVEPVLKIGRILLLFALLLQQLCLSGLEFGDPDVKDIYFASVLSVLLQNAAILSIKFVMFCFQFVIMIERTHAFGQEVPELLQHL